MESLEKQKTSSCILCKVITINDEEQSDDDKPNEGELGEDVSFLFRILLEIPPTPGISLVVAGNLINADHLLLLESNLVRWCDQCSIAIQQARKLYQQIREAAGKFRKVQRKIVETLQNSIKDDDRAFDKDDNYKVIWRKLCLHNEGRFNKFEYPFIVQHWASPVPEPHPVSTVKGDPQKESSSCHGDDSEDELACKNEEDVKNEVDNDENEVEGSNNKQQQRILLIIPEKEAGNKKDKDGDSHSLSSGMTSPHLSCSSSDDEEEDDDDEEEIIESTANSCELGGGGENDEDDPLGENFKEEPTEPELEMDQPQDNLQEGTPLQYYCAVCKITYKTKDTLNRHKKRHHSGSNKFKRVKSATAMTDNFKCLDPQCHKFFRTSAYLKMHLKRCHPHIPMPSFQKVSSFQKKYPELHSKIFRNPTTKLFQCPYTDQPPGCSKSFKMRKTCEYHLRYKHLGESGIYPCTWGHGCTRTFAVWNNYQSHMDRHKGIPRWKCDQCDQQFYVKNSFVSHRQREHEDGRAKKPFKCQICVNSFSCRDYLYMHKRTTSCKLGGPTKSKSTNKTRVTRSKPNIEDITPSSSSSPAVQNRMGPGDCEICGKFVKNLTTHMYYTHTTARKHMCHLCPKSFKSAAHLKLHLKRHEDDPSVTVQAIRKFQCSVKQGSPFDRINSSE